jgi:thioredoxin 2
MLRTCGSCGQTNRIPAEHLHQSGRCGKCKTALPPTSSPIDVSDVTTFDDIVAHARVPILVDIWAAWCGPCRMVAPEVARVAHQTAGSALVLKVDTEKLSQLAQRYRVSGIPNFAVFENGELVRQQAGAMRAQDLIRLIPNVRAA